MCEKIYSQYRDLFVDEIMKVASKKKKIKLNYLSKKCYKIIFKLLEVKKSES